MYEGKTQLTRMWVYKAEYAQKMEEHIAVHNKIDAGDTLSVSYTHLTLPTKRIV